MDNSIVTYGCQNDKVRPLKKKTFRGHNNSGYACQIGFSPNGQYITSGDGHGKLTFWEWKTGKVRIVLLCWAVNYHVHGFL
jgi:pre-mRNA-processing factor 17